MADNPMVFMFVIFIFISCVKFIDECLEELLVGKELRSTARFILLLCGVNRYEPPHCQTLARHSELSNVGNIIIDLTFRDPSKVGQGFAMGIQYHFLGFMWISHHQQLTAIG